MLGRLRTWDPGQPLAQMLFYRIVWSIVLALFTLIYRARFLGGERVPRSGGLLIVANHQSHLDPPLIAVSLMHRHTAAIAREGLFKNPVFGLILRGLGAMPIKENEGDAGAMRRAIEQLKRGRVVVIFPEGSRSPDGALKEFKRGTWLLLARSGATVLPAAVEGCFDAWPRQRTLPSVFGHRVGVSFGEPIEFASLKAKGADMGLAHLASEIETLRLDLRARIRHATHGARPLPGPGDVACAGN
ncbi:MAG: 1-acyl-sn-glycerol-3-phosphate acyltransferase [Phycisphaerales bacterium]|nr:1-acyl-sn-glycerol-3-phosphate acyltransferase [Phycisphaerales bacterium]